MNATTKTGFEPALATALAKHICEKAPFKFSGPELIQERLEAGQGLLFFGNDYLESPTVLCIFQDGQGRTCVLSGITVVCAGSEIETLQGKGSVLLQGNGDWLKLTNSSLLYSNRRDGGRSTLYVITEVTDLRVPDFVAGFNAGRNSA